MILNRLKKKALCILLHCPVVHPKITTGDCHKVSCYTPDSSLRGERSVEGEEGAGWGDKVSGVG